LNADENFLDLIFAIILIFVAGNFVGGGSNGLFFK